MKKFLSFMIVVSMVFALIPFGATAVESEIWDGSVAEGFASGDGSEENPYVITNAAELAYFSKVVMEGEDFEYDFVRLDADIVLNDTSAENWQETAKPWTPIGGTDNNSFQGTFYGNNKTVTGVYYNDSEGTYAGLFGNVHDGAIHDITVTDSYVYGYTVAGIVVGGASNTLISNCHSKNSHVEAVQRAVGGVVGYLDGDSLVMDCTNNASFESGNGEKGGIAGRIVKGTVVRCINYGDCDTDKMAGGIAGGIESGSIVYCKNYGNLLSTKGSNGGIVAKMAEGTKVSHCHNEGTLTLEYGGAGGIVCENSGGEISYCYNKGYVILQNPLKSTMLSNVGGIVGSGGASKCYNLGNILGSGSAYIGGIAGRLNGQILEYCYNGGTVNITVLSDYKDTYGGIAGTIFSGDTVNYCYTISGKCDRETGEVLGTYTNSGVVENPADQMNFKGFDFVNDWTFADINGTNYPVLHKYVWNIYESMHILECTCCSEVSVYGSHSYDDDCDEICNDCFYIREDAHDFSGYNLFTNEYHTIVCKDCGIGNDREPHDMSDEHFSIYTDGMYLHYNACTICGYKHYDEHIYDNDYDAECDICGFTREVELPDYLLGDVNGDGKLSNVDYIMLKRIVMGELNISDLKNPETALLRCDLSGDGKTRAVDYIMLKREIIG